MNKKIFTHLQVIKKIKQHEKFHQMQGTYTLSVNKTALGADINFSCSEKQMHLFVEEIFDTVFSLFSQQAVKIPWSWVAFPGIKKQDLIDKFCNTPEIYQELVQEQKDIVIVKKISDEGRDIYWE